MKTILMRWKRSAAILGAAAICLAGGGAARAAILGPYTVDASTLHLYHLDEAAGSTSSADATGAQNMQGVLNGATLGNSSHSAAFGTSLDTSANALLPGNAAQANPPHRPVLLAASALSNADADGVTLDWAGADGSFTLEAIVKFDAATFAVNSTNFRNGAGGSTGGNYPMEIISGEGDANGTRLLQFRINQIGAGSAANVAGGTGTGAVRLELASLRGIVSNQGLVINLPTTGANAINNTDWFHVAATYNGAAGTANNVSFYWTKVDPTATVANLIGQGQLNLDPVEGLTGFAIGNESRDTGSGAGEGESFVGRIDEVRISGVARGADQFIFGVPEPSTCMMAAAGLLLSGVRRRRNG
jgi:hypothetical protein